MNKALEAEGYAVLEVGTEIFRQEWDDGGFTPRDARRMRLVEVGRCGRLRKGRENVTAVGFV